MVRRETLKRLNEAYLEVMSRLRTRLKVKGIDESLMWLSTYYASRGKAPSRYIRLMQRNVDLTQSVALIPHLYDFWFPVSGSPYIAIANLHYDSTNYITDLTIVAEIWTDVTTNGYGIIESFDASEYFRFTVGGDWAAIPYKLAVITPQNGQMTAPYSVADGGHHFVATIFDSVSLLRWLYIDADRWSTSYTGYAKSNSGLTRYGFIGVGSEAPSFDGSKGPLSYYRKRLLYVLHFHRVFTQEELDEIRLNHSFDANQLQIFYEPTAYDGSKFVDLSDNGNHGYPRNGVTRVEAKEKWLWLVKGTSSTRVRWTPLGTCVRLLQSGKVVDELIAVGNTMLGMTNVDLPQIGVCDVEVLIPQGAMALHVFLRKLRQKQLYEYAEIEAEVVDEVGTRIFDIGTSWTID